MNDLAPDEVTVLHGVPVTTPARTLLDLAGYVGRDELEQMLTRGEQLRLVTRDALRAMLERHPHHGGAPALRQLLEGNADAPCGSAAE